VTALPKQRRARFEALRTIYDFPNRAHNVARVASAPDFTTLEKNVVMTFLRKHSNNLGSGEHVAVYDFMCRFNHTCIRANIERRGDPTVHVTCWTLADVKKGEELRTSYPPKYLMMTVEQRKQALPANGNFHVCECSTCSSNGIEKVLSDMRRILMRNLLIAISSQDTCETLSRGHATAVRQQMLDATRTWPEDARQTIYIFALASLAEAEGIVELDFPWPKLRCVCWFVPYNILSCISCRPWLLITSGVGWLARMSLRRSRWLG
jgi:hypothetical protein